MKKMYFLGMTAIMMVGCTSEEFLGESSSQLKNEQGGAIEFAGFKPNMTRANLSGQDAATELGSAFKVYGTKTLEGKTVNVFATTAWAEAGTTTAYTPYDVWYDAATTNKTESNVAGWEYVSVQKNQEIKYWDNNATRYNFIAFTSSKPNENTDAAVISQVKEQSAGTLTVDINDGNNGGITAEQLAKVYVSKEVTMAPQGNKNAVQFEFHAASAKVRLGIYETVPGYNIKNVKFTTADNYDTNAELKGSFLNKDTYTATWKKGTTPGTSLPVVTGTNADLTTGQDGNAAETFNFGAFTQGFISTTNATPTYAGVKYTGNDTYSATPTMTPTDAKLAWTPVLPTTKSAAMTLKIQFDLVSSIGEVITVKDATAIVPAEYLVFQNNYAYTYIFKISDETNGLYPITFDAVVVQPLDETQEGVTSAVNSAYTITTYQPGSTDKNDANGITYVTNKDIYVTVGDANGLQTLTTSNIEVMAITGTTTTVTEAALANGSIEWPTTGNLITEVPTANAEIGSVDNPKSFTLTAGQYVNFKPSTAGTYAVRFEYTKDQKAAYAYKVITVNTAN